MRQFQFRVGSSNFALIHVSLVPDMHGEQKTKPTQATVRDLRGLGLLPDLVSSSSCVALGFTESLIADRLSTFMRRTTHSGSQGQDLHVLSCRQGASSWDPQRLVCLSCSSAFGIPRHYWVPSEETQPQGDFCSTDYDRQGYQSSHSLEGFNRDVSH